MSDQEKSTQSDLHKKVTTDQMTAAVRLAWKFVKIGFGLAGFGLVITLFSGGFTLSNLSSLGSYLQGAVGSIWALSGLLFIYATFQAQRQQLQRQDEELERQEKQFKQQSFENTFFQMLNLYNQIVSDLSYTQVMLDPKIHGGRNCFKFWYEHFKSGDWGLLMTRGYEPKMLMQQIKTAYEDLDLSVEQIAEEHKCQPNYIRDLLLCSSSKYRERESKSGSRYIAFYKDFQESLGHYFRTFFHLIKFVDESASEDKRRYTSLVRAQLSSYELVFLFYDSLSPYSSGKMQKYIKAYDLLEHLDKALLLSPEDVKIFENVYGEKEKPASVGSVTVTKV